MWGEITVDEKRGIAYLPVSSPTYDYYGADRIGMNLFSDCLLALDARTGKRLWHFQMVHHDLWDYDPTAAPQLLTVRKDGKRIDAVAQATKQGFVFVFDRVTGKPVWPIEERAVPKSDMPGEQAWPTQPFSTLPPSARQVVKPDDLTPYLISDAERAAWRERISKARTGMFTPPALTESAIVPGAVGGTNWGNTAANPKERRALSTEPGLSPRSTSSRCRTRAHAGGARPLRAAGPREVARGQGLYKESCAMCHGEDRGGTPAAPSLLTIGSQIGFPQLKRTIVYGNGRMPPIGHISDSRSPTSSLFSGVERGRAFAAAIRRRRRPCRPGRWSLPAARRASRVPPSAGRRHAGLPGRSRRAGAALLHGLRPGLSLSTRAALVDDRRV